MFELYNCFNPAKNNEISYITSWQHVLRYGKSIFTKQSQAIEFFVVLALDYYVNSGQLLNLYLLIFARDVVCIE